MHTQDIIFDGYLYHCCIQIKTAKEPSLVKFPVGGWVGGQVKTEGGLRDCHAPSEGHDEKSSRVLK